MEGNGVIALGSVAELYLVRQGDWKINVGGAVLGNLGGVLGYEIWRWGVRREEAGWWCDDSFSKKMRVILYYPLAPSLHEDPPFLASLFSSLPDLSALGVRPGAELAASSTTLTSSG